MSDELIKNFLSFYFSSEGEEAEEVNEILLYSGIDTKGLETAALKMIDEIKTKQDEEEMEAAPFKRLECSVTVRP